MGINVGTEDTMRGYQEWEERRKRQFAINLDQFVGYTYILQTFHETGKIRNCFIHDFVVVHKLQNYSFWIFTT